MDYEQLRRETNIGWNTWNTSSVTSHALLPYGFAINLCFKDHSTDRVLRGALIGRHGADEEQIFPGIRSWDGGYTSMNVKYLESEFDVESCAVNGEQYILVTPRAHGIKPVTLIVEGCLLWGRDGAVGKKNGRLFADFADGKYIEVYTSGKVGDMPYTFSDAPSFTVELTEPVAVSTVPCGVAEVRGLLARARAGVESEAAAFGGNAETYAAMKTCLAWDTIYDSEKDRVMSTVSRIWNVAWGGFVLFDWDTYFASVMASVGDKKLAYLNAFAITNEATERGFIPNFAGNDDIKSRDRSQPPVGSATAMLLYKKFGEDWILRELYPKLLRWNEWFFENRTARGGYMCWGSNGYEPVAGRLLEKTGLADHSGAMYESGLDNSPMYDGAQYDEKTGLMQLADVGLMGLYINDCRCLIEMCGIVGRPEDSAALRSRLTSVERALDTLWSEEDGIYENRDLATGELSRRVSPTNFYALFSDNVAPERKKSMLERYFYSPKHFWGDYIMPSISRSDPGYKDQDYWRGRIWAPMNMLVYEAFRRAGLDRDADVLAEKSRELLLKEWRAHGHVHENYSGDDGWGCGVPNSDKFYHWGGLLGYIAIDAVS